MYKSPITTHVLDTARGRPARALPVVLEIQDGKSWRPLAAGVTDEDGRVMNLLPAEEPLAAGIYRLTFDTSQYRLPDCEAGFYPCVPVVFRVEDPAQHYHVPLLLSPFGYSTYRGS